MKEIAAAIIVKDQKVLICQREEGGNCSLLWEFPGGKREPEEDFAHCAVRECKEELEIDIKIQSEFSRKDYFYGKEPFHFVFYLCRIEAGTPKRLVHRQILWADAKDLKHYEFCPADKDVVDQLAKKLMSMESKS